MSKRRRIHELNLFLVDITSVAWAENSSAAHHQLRWFLSIIKLTSTNKIRILK